MLLPGRLNASERRELFRALADHHSIEVEVRILDLEENPIDNIRAKIISGQVDVDMTAETTRSCSIEFLDPKRSIHLDGDSPADGALYMDNMLDVRYRVRTDSMGWVGLPVFRGPVVSVDRNDDLVTVVCHGKELLGLHSAWVPVTYREGVKKTRVIRDVLDSMTGEVFFDFVERDAKLGDNWSFGKTSYPWNKVRRLAADMGLQLFYDGRGVCRLRKPPERAGFVFRTGNGGTIIEYPTVRYNSDNFKNAVRVTGGKFKGGKRLARGKAVLPHWHKQGPVSLGRYLVPRYLGTFVKAENLHFDRECEDRAIDILNELQRAEVDVAFDALPIPMLEPGDLVKVRTPEFEYEVRLRQFTLPLVVGDNMTINYNRKIRAGKKKKHRPIQDMVWNDPPTIQGMNLEGNASDNVWLHGASW